MRNGELLSIACIHTPHLPTYFHLYRGRDVLVEGFARSNIRQIYGTSMDTYTPVTLLPYLFRPPLFSDHNSPYTVR